MIFRGLQGLNAFLLFSFLLFEPIYSQNFQCNHLLSPVDHQNLLTFEYTSPGTKNRGVVCIAMLNNRESLVMYMEEEVNVVGQEGAQQPVTSATAVATESETKKKKHKKRKLRKRVRRRVNRFLHRNKLQKNNSTDAEPEPIENTNAQQTPLVPAQRLKHKQAIGRAHRSPSSESLYTGIIHVIKNIADDEEDLYDLDSAPFTLNFTPETGLATFSIRSRLSSTELIYIWLPRAFVNHWVMRIEIPKDCGAIESLRITDPISQSVPDRQGIVCILQNTPSTLKYFSLGWRKSGVEGKPRKFINFGSLRSASTNFVNIYTGRVHNLEFPSPCQTKHIQTDRLAFKDTFIISAVKSVNSKSLMVYGDLQELWYDPKTPLDPTTPPKYPFIPNNFDSDYSSDLKLIYGLPHQ